MIYDERQDKYFHEGQWLTEQEFIGEFLELLEHNQRAMGASPRKGFYDRKLTSVGGKITNKITFEAEEDEGEIKELLVQLELDIKHGVDDSLVLGSHQHNSRERTFRGGIIRNQAEF